jgi:hypothetical protein
MCLIVYIFFLDCCNFILNKYILKASSFCGGVISLVVLMLHNNSERTPQLHRGGSHNMSRNLGFLIQVREIMFFLNYIQLNNM